MLTRRQLVLAALGGAAGMALHQGAAAGVASGTTLPAPKPWRPRAGDVDPAVKLQATRFVEAVGNRRDSGGSMASARTRATAAGFDGSLVATLGMLLGPGTANVVRIRMAQYGGLLDASASVLLVVDSWRAQPDGTVAADGVTLDVRLRRASPRWQLLDVFPARAAHTAARQTTLEEDVLGSARIRLPHSAHADVLGGGIHASVLRTLLDLSASHVVDVSVMQSGHPKYVFGTRRLSDHPQGRAVDIWALDGRPLGLPANHALATNAMRFAVTHGAYNVGGPELLRGPQFFSDRTHQDHIHLGFAT